MTLSQSPLLLPVPLDHVMEIQSLAEAGRFGDALIRVRKIQTSSPRNTFLVALEKQFERLMVLPAEADARVLQRTELLGSIPKLLSCAVEGMRLSSMATAVHSRTPQAPRKAKSEKEEARDRLKEQYFSQAEEYLKQGAFGSALVEIRRVRIIAPDDQTVAEYERIIRQLVELKQRSGIHPLSDDTVPTDLRERGAGIPTGKISPAGTDSTGGPKSDDPHQLEKNAAKWFGSKLLMLVIGTSVALAVAGAAAAL